ncbi:MAG: glycogen/starch synthase [Bacteroidota bacterium]|jgi:starch synthase
MNGEQHHVVMVASENDALIGGKAGGVGDVIRGLPNALAALGWQVTVITPAYGFLHKNNPSKLHSTVRFPFYGRTYEGEIWSACAQQPVDGVSHFVFEHADIRGEPIYVNDPPETPFRRDATKYALFCSAVGVFLKTIKTPYILHLHDWHAATLLLLRELHEDFYHMRGVKTIFTIHNLAIQGTRPMQGDESSMESWFPELFRNQSWVASWKDHRYEVPCYTPMAVGIRCSDAINTVSPNYAEEILKPGDPAVGFHGGDGLEDLLQGVKDRQRLFGILNGCDYGNSDPPKKSFGELCDLIKREFTRQNDKEQIPMLAEVLRRIDRFKADVPKVVLTSVTRIVEQKVRLMLAKTGRAGTALDKILDKLEEYGGLYIVLGTGTPEFGHKLSEVFKRHERFIFINGYSSSVAEALYANGTLFLMPSIFEPCGISQMLAMREGQPCVVHRVGGLRDTVIDNMNGFSFSGRSVKEKAENFVQTVERAVKICVGDPQLWKSFQEEAARARFTWKASAKKYVGLMYC